MQFFIKISLTFFLSNTVPIQLVSLGPLQFVTHRVIQKTLAPLYPS